MRRLALLVVLSLVASACADERPSAPVGGSAAEAAGTPDGIVADTDAAQPDVPEPLGEEESGSVASGAETTPGEGARSPPADAEAAGDVGPPLRGVAVCEALAPALTAETPDTLGLGRYAAPAVIATLRENGLFRGEAAPGADDLGAWTDDGAPARCNLSAGGDAWYMITLSPRGDGEVATDIRLTTSYAEGGP